MLRKGKNWLKDIGNILKHFPLKKLTRNQTANIIGELFALVFGIAFFWIYKAIWAGVLVAVLIIGFYFWCTKTSYVKKQ